MKKALALVLALVLALSMAVSAFAAQNLVVLEPVSSLSTVKKIDLEKNILKEKTNAVNEKVFVAEAKGGTYYFLIDAYTKLYNVATTSNGSVTTEIVAFDPATMKRPTGISYVVYDAEAKVFAADVTAAKANFYDDYKAQKDALTAAGDTTPEFTAPQYKLADETVYTTVSGDYEFAAALAKYLSDGAKVGGKYVAIPCTMNAVGAWVPASINVLKVVVEPNYTAAYKEGTFKVTATYDKAGKLAAEFEGEVISDVTIFEYEQVKWAAAEEEVLTVGVKGYSDYETALAGYDTNGKYVVNDLRKVDGASVVSTTAFRAIAGEDLYVESERIEVALYDVAAGQKGVNFAAYNGDKVDPVTKEFLYYEFGFYGDQIVKGAFEINVELPYDWFTLRERFGLKVEEDDIISYYLIDENGKVVGGKEVDYMTADITEKVEFTIKGENAKLGQYKVVLEVPAEEVGEANPNTGAEAVVGVVAALAVVSVATAAAVSLKK